MKGSDHVVGDHRAAAGLDRFRCQSPGASQDACPDKYVVGGVLEQNGNRDYLGRHLIEGGAFSLLDCWAFGSQQRGPDQLIHSDSIR